MRKPSYFLPAILSLGLLSAAAEPKLKIGDPAPPLKAAKWFKGGPVTGFDSNQVYVVEFWATWCAPCRKSIPHLTELAKRFEGKARIIGFSIWEAEKRDQAKRLAQVGQFVEAMGDEMGYSVAADDSEGSMARNWMDAAGEGGIPTAFIVGKDGRIAWIGYPWQQMDAMLEHVVAGTLDTKAVLAAAAERQKEKDAQTQLREWLQPVTDLQAKGKSREAIAELDQAIAAHPELGGRTGYLRYKLLLAYDEPAAYREARRLFEGELKANAGALYSIARDLTDPPGRKTKDWDLAFDVSHRGAELSGFSNPSYLSTLAEAYFGKSDFARAIETELSALKHADADSSFPDGSKRYLQRRLEVFKAARQKAGGERQSN